MEKIYFIVIVFLLSVSNVQTKCRINISIKNEKDISQTLKDTLKIYTIENPFPMIFSKINKIKEFKKIAPNLFQYDVNNNDTIIFFSISPISWFTGILIKNENEINITITISEKDVRTNIESNDIQNFNKNIYLTGDNFVDKLRQDSLTKNEVVNLIDSVYYKRIFKLDKLLSKKQLPVLYNYYLKLIEIQNISNLVYFYLMQYDDKKMNDSVLHYMNKQNNQTIIYNKDFYILCSTYLDYLHKIFKKNEDDKYKISNFIDSNFSGLTHDIISVKFLEELLYFEKRDKENIEFMNNIFKLIENPIIKQNFGYIFNKYMKIIAGQAPSFTLPDSHGNTFCLDSAIGSVIYLDFWGMWCSPCIEELSHLEQLKSELRKYDIKFISIACEHFQKEKWLKMIKDKHLSDIQLYAEYGYDSKVVKDYLTTYFPRFLIIDKTGKIYDSDAQRPSNPKLKEILIKLATGK